MKITIERPAVKPLNVTGAALRSVKAADAAADAAYAHAEKCAENLTSILMRENPTASDIADAIEGNTALQHAVDEIKKLAKRHSSGYAASYSIWPFCGNIANGASSAVSAVINIRMADLREAGVEMTSQGCALAQYWRDAAARGC